MAGGDGLRNMREIRAGLGPGGTHVTGSTGVALRAAAVCYRVAGLRHVVEGNVELATGAGKESVGEAQGKRGKGKSGATRRGPRIVGGARHAERPLRSSVVRLDLFIRDGPVLGHPVERAHPEVVGAEAERGALPVEGAPAHAPRSIPLEPVADAAPGGIAIDAGERAQPRVLAPREATRVLSASREIVARARFEHHHANASSRQLQGHDAAGRSRPDDTDLRLLHLVGHGHPLGLRARVARQVTAAAGKSLVSDSGPAGR